MQRSIACALTNRAFALAMSGSALFSGLTLALSPSMAAELAVCTSSVRVFLLRLDFDQRFRDIGREQRDVEKHTNRKEP